MKQITLVGSGEQGLATGNELIDIGYPITWLSDTGNKPSQNWMSVTDDKAKAYQNASIIFIDTGDIYEAGHFNSSKFEMILSEIAEHVRNDFLLVITNDVPVGTNKWALNLLREKFGSLPILFDIVTNPGGLSDKEVVIGTRCRESEEVLKYLYEPYQDRIVYTSPEEAEMKSNVIKTIN
ncbi:hypothetical protein [Pseudalkalibacillus berkeleyi]|uniref:Uncharacterized protein n=1 Tax=Pseudalkalibacillus berkeleyi TaxID=1069813 RepID=A0ABS9H4M9_9BACL|nr:hypothetical protein [Pseudalkalibacillus berkeleyi]MCF6138787.1 hypothetical protein [Pseudalkalibacillus berkeleyi]